MTRDEYESWLRVEKEVSTIREDILPNRGGALTEYGILERDEGYV